MAKPLKNENTNFGKLKMNVAQAGFLGGGAKKKGQKKSHRGFTHPIGAKKEEECGSILL